MEEVTKSNPAYSLYQENLERQLSEKRHISDRIATNENERKMVVAEFDKAVISGDEKKIGDRQIEINNIESALHDLNRRIIALDGASDSEHNISLAEAALTETEHILQSVQKDWDRLSACAPACAG